MNLFPWQTQIGQRLWQLKTTERLPHALLLTGMAGIGKARCADYFSRALLCSRVNAEGQACGTCHSCRLVQGKVHPNVLWVQPEKESEAIKVDQIRAVSEFTQHSALDGDYRIIILNPAQAMNRQAANALLKTLEEPSSGSLLILITDQAPRLPATMLSRCQRIDFPKPNAADVLPWLKNQLKDETSDPELLLHLAQGAPLIALRLAEKEMQASRRQLLDALYQLSQQRGNPLQFARDLQAMALIPSIDIMLSWIMDVVRLQLGGELQQVVNRDDVPALLEVKQKTTVEKNIRWMDELQQLRAQLCQGIQLNKQLMLENIFIRWRNDVSC